MLDELAVGLGIEPARLRQCLARAVQEGQGRWIDSGGVRVAWNGDRTTIEVYTVLPVSPADLLELP